MEYVRNYFFNNFFLLCLTFGVIFMVLQNYRSKRVAVLMPILIVSSAVFISIAYAVEEAVNKYDNFRFLATFCSYLGFIIRPLVVYFFMRLAISNKIILRIAIGLVIVNAVVYTSTIMIFSDAISHLVFWYEVVPGSGSVFHRGPLYFFSYFVAGAMIAYLVYVSIISLKGRHRYDALACLICVAFIGIAVILETSLIADNLLNTTIAISCLFYIVHLYQQASRRDGLTSLYDRKTFYGDLNKMGTRLKGLIMVDMNSLKRINDNEGHEAGDIALITIAKILENSADRRCMYAYRLGGDEFIILSCSTKPVALIHTANIIREAMNKTPYFISLGYANVTDEEGSFKKAMKTAENMMYDDKAEYYRITGIERRRN